MIPLATTAPANWAIRYPGNCAFGSFPARTIATETAGLICAPEAEPKRRINPSTATPEKSPSPSGVMDSPRLAKVPALVALTTRPRVPRNSAR